MDIYATYSNYVNTLISTGDLSSFKRNIDYTYMLEHVNYPQGFRYLSLLKNIFTLDVITTFCNMNDSVGNPEMFSYPNLRCSPSSLRYLYHAHLILTHYKNYSLTDIVEIGGGYGGLYLAINFLYKSYSVNIASYTIIDLPSISKFQRLYTDKFNTTISLNCLESTNFGNEIDNSNMFFISCYSFSEIPSNLQQQYIETLFPKISHGFIAWNNIPVYDFGFTYTEEQEIPKTGPMNKYVRF